MPTICRSDNEGCYCQWGKQTKYRYKCGDKAGRERAKGKANAQGRAIHSQENKGAYSTGFKGKI